MPVMVTPGGFNQFFEELSSLNKGLPFPNRRAYEFLRVGPARTVAVLNRDRADESVDTEFILPSPANGSHNLGVYYQRGHDYKRHSNRRNDE